MADRKIIRTGWVFYMTLAVVTGQLALWVMGTIQILQTLRPFLAVITPMELVEAAYTKLGALRFIQFYVFGVLNILIYLSLALLLSLGCRRAMAFFQVSVFVVVVQQMLDAILTLPGGSERDWVTTIVGNLSLAVFLGLLYLGFTRLVAVPSFDAAADEQTP